MSCRKKYIETYGIIPEDFHVHHIIPKHDGGLDDLSNLVALSREDHANAHLERYYLYRDFKDLCAYHLILNQYDDALKICCSVGGKIGGNKVKELRVGICTDNSETRKKHASMGGKVGGKKQFEMGVGIHAQTREERLEIASRGGKKGAFTQSKWQSEFGKRGGVKNKGFIWINDGEKSLKYTLKQQEEKSLEQFLIDNPQFRKGRHK